MSFFYTEYYRRAIAEHPTGLKFVLGGTGLGKTSSLGALLHSPDCPPDVKFVYVANRVQLLDEVAEQVSDLNLHVQQRQDVDQLRDAVADGTLDGFFNLPLTPKLLEDYNRLNAASPIELTVLTKKTTQFKRLQRYSEFELADVIDFTDLAREVLRPLKRLLTHAVRLSEQPPVTGQLITQRQAADVMAHPLWYTLFPYRRFQIDPDVKLLLVTVQKAFRGLFDGRRSVRLGTWPAPASGRYVFVFDEFDFLENDLLKLLSEDREVSDPFGLVRTFQERMKDQKLSHAGYLTQKPSWQAIREQLTEICNRVDALQTTHGIDFPNITHFVTRDNAIRGKAIFQSNYSLVTQPVFLRDPSSRPNSFDLTTNKTGKSAFVLLDVVNRAVKDIVRLFKRLETDHEDIHPELLRQCFGGTDYLREIRSVKQIGRHHEWCETNYGHLLANGFGLYEVRTDRSQLTDPDEVEIRYLSVNTSPEAMMREMCRVHLVFGLSATAHVQRTLRNFDWTGLAHPLSPDQSFQPLPITTADEDDVKRANEAKAAVRNNAVRFEITEPLPLGTAFGQQLESIADRSGAVFGEGERKTHRLRRVRHFFGLLLRIAQRQPTEGTVRQTHLVFLSSVKQIGYLLGEVKSDEDGWFRSTPRSLSASLPSLERYDVTYRDEETGRHLDYHVVLYDARFGQELRKDPALEEEYNALFWDGKPVVVVTTYPSAGNGVNLQYFLTRADFEANRREGKRDFTHLHLLDSPYFYFSGIRPENSNAENLAAIKRDVYGIMKLLHAKRALSEAQALGQLHHIRRLNLFNKQYLALPDGVLNQFTVFVQALGRIERVWQPTDDQTVHLDKDVYGVFERFLTERDMGTERRNFLRFASSTLRLLLSAMERHAGAHRDALEDELLDLNRINERARQAIHQMVADIQRFRQTGQPNDVRKRWQKLREDVLKHNVEASSLGEIGGVFQTSYARDGQLHINRQRQIAPPTVQSHEFERWDLNAVYRPLTVVKNTALSNHFRVRGYELAFTNTGRFLLPYVYQAILTGAVGEEATQAILRMRGVMASGETIPDALFEVADLRVEDRPVFIDCKNYGTRTLRHFALPPDDPLHQPTLNEPHFKDKMVAKWKLLHRHVKQVERTATDEPCRLIIFNLVSDDEGALRFYNAQFEAVGTWDDARIAVLTGALKPQPPGPKDLLTPACNTLISHLLQ